MPALVDDNKKMMGVPKAYDCRALVEPKSVNEEDRTVQLKYTTGARVLRYDWWNGEYYYQELSLKPGHVRLDRLKSGAPLLNSHQAYDLEAQIGTVVQADESEATVKFSNRESVNSIWQDVKDGIIKNVSVGFLIHKNMNVTQEDDEYTVYRAVDWEPMEISLVPIPADAGAQVRSQDGKPVKPEDLELYSCEIVCEAEQKGRRNMPKPNENQNQPAGSTPSAPNNADPANDKVDFASQKVTPQEVIDLVSKYSSQGLDIKFAQELISQDLNGLQVRERIADKLLEKQKDGAQTISASGIVVGTEAKEKFAMQAEQAILHKINPVKFKLEGANVFRGSSLIEMYKHFLEASGESVKGLTPNEIYTRGMHSTSDFPEILANVANKTLRTAYAEAQRTFQAWARRTTVRDFKTVKRVQLGAIKTLEAVVEGAEIKKSSITEGSESYNLVSYGTIVSLTRQALINDDLSAFDRILGEMARAAARLESKIVYEILTTPATMGDGEALFHATSSNGKRRYNQTNAKLTTAGLSTAKALMLKQKHLDGTTTLGIRPKFLIVGPDQEDVALTIVNGTIVPNETGKVNVHYGQYQVVSEASIANGTTDNFFFLAADPNSGIDTVEYAYLEGQEGPVIETEKSFTTKGMEFSILHDFAAKAIDHRGLVKSTNDAS